MTQLKLVSGVREATSSETEKRLLKDEPFLVFDGLKPFYSSNGSIYSAYQADSSFPVSVNFDTANRHLAVLGSTGTGKSSGVLRPAALRLIESGCSGVLFDWKGDYRYLMALYPERIQLVDPDTWMKPVNLLAGMDSHEIVTLLESTCGENRHQPYFGSKMSSILRFVIRTFQLAGRSITLSSLYQALAMPKEGFIPYFDSLISEKVNLPHEYMTMVRSHAQDFFSILAVGLSEHLGKLASNEIAQAARTDYAEVVRQYEWQIGQLKAVLEPFDAQSPLRQYLSSSNKGANLDIEDLIYKQRKILLVRLKTERYGQASVLISRLLRTQLISTMKKAAPDYFDGGLGRNWYTFMHADEYQNTCLLKDASSSKGFYYDDESWFAEAREYGHINVVGFQGVTSLKAAQGADKVYGIRSLLQNMGTLVAFSCSDRDSHEELAARAPMQQRNEIVSHLSADLPVGQALVICQYASDQGAFKVRTGAKHLAPWMALQNNWLKLGRNIQPQPPEQTLIKKPTALTPAKNEIEVDIDDIPF